MGGVTVEDRIRDAADRVWKGLEARDELAQLIRDNKGSAAGKIGPTRIAALTDFLYRPEHVTRIAASEPARSRKRRRREVEPDALAS